ncbi:hypothetical protein M514_26685 [Trichuris suis]|uniref:Uncharacterized protein n=1 Tax=Trichuris suis TaxID=68888 RepID=A0A085MV96_9BILA|nr:hypothetical protein M514_26685 [Trichuris suis]
MTFTGKIICSAAAAKEYLRDELGKLDEWPQINVNEPMEMDQEGRTKLKELNGGKLTKSNRPSTARNDSDRGQVNATATRSLRQRERYGKVKLSLICKLRKINDVANVIPLRLASGALAVYLELSDSENKNVERLKDLRRLASLFGGVPEKELTCAFVTGLPDSIWQLLRAGCRMEDLTLEHVLARA